MRWMDLDDEEVDEYGGRATVLDWAQQRPLTAVVMVLVVWLAFIFAAEHGVRAVPVGRPEGR